MSQLIKFADNTKLEGITNTEEDWNITQEEPDDFENWSNRNQMKHNSAEYKIINLLATNNNFFHKLGAHRLKMVEKRKI